MKKLILSLVLLSLLMTGCSSSENTATCTLDNESIVAYADEDIIQKVEITLVSSLEELGISEEEYEDFVSALEAEYYSREGVEVSVTKDKNAVIILLASDYTILNPTIDPVGFAEFVNNLKSEGYTCKIK